MFAVLNDKCRRQLARLEFTILVGVLRREDSAMHVLILIEPIEGGRFCARAGNPFGVSAEGKTAEEATQHLKTILQNRLQTGSRLALLDLGNGSPLSATPLNLEPLPADDWFFQTMREAIAEIRQQEDDADQRRGSTDGNGNQGHGK